MRREPGNAPWVAARETTALAGFQQSIEASVPALRRYARALTRDADLADDLVQDTLVRALRSEHLFHGGEMRSWLYTILTNLNRNRLRSQARRPTMVAIGDSEPADLAGPDGGGRDIERALATLADNQALGAAARRARRAHLPGGRRDRVRADRNRHVAPRAGAHADVESLFGRRAPRASPHQMT